VYHSSTSTTRTRLIASLQPIGGDNIINQYTEILHLALSPDARYVTWTAENPDLGFGFYDMWLLDMSDTGNTPIRIAEAISNPSVRPSRMVWIG
jgi:hypothetical protein